jgi:calcium-dependent protein kinase
MGTACSTDNNNKKPKPQLDKKKTQLPIDKKSLKDLDPMMLSELGIEQKKGIQESQEKQEKPEKPAQNKINLKDKFFLQFDNPLVRTHSKDNKKLDELYQTLNLISTEEKVNNYKVKHTKIGLLRNMLKCEKDSIVLNKVIKEANVQKGLDHPSILKIFEIFDGPEYVVIGEINDGRKLFDEINDIGPFQEKIAANLIYQLLNVVNYLHKNKRLIHTRINPGTIVVNTYDDDNEYYDIKLINYHDCISIDMPKVDTNTNKLFEKYKVNFLDDSQNNNLINQDIFNYFGESFIDRFFVAPETIKEDNFDEQSDIYSVGIIAYYIITGKIPYISYCNSDPRDYIMNNKTSNEFNDPLFENISSQGKNLIKSMINKNPKYRITAEKALKSNWFITLETKKTLKVPNNEYKNILHNIETYKRTNRLQEMALSFLVHNIPDIDDIRNINKVYSNFNSTFDGKMPLKQLQEGFENYLNSKSLEKSEFDKKMKGIFDLLDTNKNEFIDYEEFCRGGIDKQLFTDKDVLQFAFDFIDKDGSGTINFQELRVILSKDDNLKEVEQIIEEFEMGDGNINALNFEKFEEMMNNYLNKNEEN